MFKTFWSGTNYQERNVDEVEKNAVLELYSQIRGLLTKYFISEISLCLCNDDYDRKKKFII